MAEEKGEKSVVRPDPFGGLDLFEGWPFREIGRRHALERLLGEGGRGQHVPAVDIHEDDEGFTITAELPGAKKDDVSVEMHENVLTIRGEKRSEREEKQEKTRWVERSYGAFTRSFTLPANADADRIKASFQDGVLTVEIGKAEETKPKVISIRS